MEGVAEGGGGHRTLAAQLNATHKLSANKTKQNVRQTLKTSQTLEVKTTLAKQKTQPQTKDEDHKTRIRKTRVAEQLNKQLGLWIKEGTESAEYGSKTETRDQDLLWWFQWFASWCCAS